MVSDEDILINKVLGGAMKEFSFIGKPVVRVDALAKVTGEAVYGYDLAFPGMLFGRVLRSKYAHAKILNIDISKASKVVGVRAVMTGKDIPITFGVPNLGIVDQPIFAIDKVRYHGDAVAGVAAVDEDTAEEALDLIKVEYEELPAVFDPLEAMAPGAPLIHENLHLYRHPPYFYPIAGSNICHHAKLRKGDIERGFKESDFVFENTFKTQMAQHCAIEPHMAVAMFDSNGRITVWVPNDAPHLCRLEVAEAFQLPLSKVRIISPFQGGGFGGKGGLTVEPIAIALALRAGGKPVKVAFSRSEEFISTMNRHPSIIDIKTGVKKNGMLWASKVKVLFDTGAYAEKGPTVLRCAALSASGPYRIPHLQQDGYCVYTNNPIAGAFRGFGCPQITWAHESQMDIIADELKIDPLEIRLKNAFETGDVNQTGRVLKGVGLKECLQKAANQIGWHKRGKNENRGIGIACMHKWQIRYSSQALVKVNADGTVSLSVGTMEIGTGCNTILSQILAEELGIPIENITITTRDTDYTPYDTSTCGSRSTFMMGTAVMKAARDAREQFLNLAAHFLEENKEDLVTRGGQVFVKTAPERSVTFAELASKALFSEQGQIIGKGFYSYPPETFDPETGQGWDPVWMYAAQAAEVEIDRETGLIKVVRLVGAHDVGKAINPITCEGQIEGSLVMGLGTTLWEEMVLKEGRVLNPNFTDYKLATSLDIPEIYPILVEESHDEGPYGAKGLGEPALAPTAAAIANAVYDTLKIRIKTTPLTAEKILRALKERK